MNAVPTIYYYLLNFPGLEDYDLSSVKWFSYAGAPFPTEQLKKCIELIGPKFTNGLGATEGGPWAALLAYQHKVDGPETRLLRSVGTETIMCETKIVDELGNEVKEGEVGELIVKTKATMLGYWKDPEKTNLVIKDGWYWTGDMGKKENNFIFLVDRKSDLIKSGGEKVYPFEVENVLYEHPGVDEVIVVGVPDPKWGQSVHAVIKLKKPFAQKYKGNEKEIEQIFNKFCHEHLAGYKCPKNFEFWKKSLPKTAVGKPMRKDIKKSLNEG